MIIGIVRENKPNENRVAMTPAGVEAMKQGGHTILVEQSAGTGSGFNDNAYINAGADIIDVPENIYSATDMIIHVKEPLSSEYNLIRKNQIIFTYFHFAASEALTKAIMDTGCIAIAYETIVKPDGSLPLLKPMSEVAGRMSVQQAAKYLEMPYGGKGILLGGVPGVEPATVLILGGGIVGTNAAKMACGMGARVYLLDVNIDRLRYLSDVMPKNCFLLMSTPQNIRRLLREADVVIGAVLVHGAKAPKLITGEMIKEMKKGSILVDVAIDQGGSFETSKPTTHDNPIYSIDGIIHYCVSNMPGAVANTSTTALTNATLPYALEIAKKGWEKACLENEEIKKGINVVNGKITCKAVADTFDLPYTPVEHLLKG
ncbi:MAG: alanine dehydrogenase [Desulfobacterales bacterium]|nr:alanine dehydrogenase [Desulfobacterales bacterium]